MSGKDRLSRESAAVQFTLATLWQTRGQPERAMAGYEALIRRHPDYLPAHLELGRLLLRHGSMDQATAVYRRARELNPHEACFQQQLAALATPRVAPAEPLVEAAGINSFAADQSGSTRRHIVVYTDCSGIGGAEQITHALIMMLVVRGYRVTCVQGWDSHSLLEERKRHGVRHVWLEDDTLYDLTRPARALTDDTEPRRILHDTRPDLLIFSDGAPMSNLMAKQVAREFAIPYVITVHCVAAPWAKHYAPYLGQLPGIYREAGAVIAVSHANLRMLREHFGLPDGYGQVIHNGRPARFFAPRDPTTRNRVRRDLGIPLEAVLVCTVASMETRKGYHHLLRAITELRGNAVWPLLYFAWVGTGTLEPRLRAAVDQIGVQERVRFLGTRADIVDLLDAADIFALASHYEGMPLSVMEAMARGVPVAATAVSGIPEELGDTGKLLPDPMRAPQIVVSELVATIGAWAINDRLRQVVGHAGRRRAEALFAEDRMLDEYRDIVTRVLDSIITANQEGRW